MMISMHRRVNKPSHVSAQFSHVRLESVVSVKMKKNPLYTEYQRYKTLSITTSMLM